VGYQILPLHTALTEPYICIQRCPTQTFKVHFFSQRQYINLVN
jgi:hypothetical protein